MRLLLLLAVIAIGLALTNPGPDAFEAFVEDEVAGEIQRQAGALPGGGILGDLGGLAAGRLVQRYADRDNYVVASVYTLDLDGRAREDVEWRFLGIATLFIPLKEPDLDGSERR